jgi:hypothetical protein
MRFLKVFAAAVLFAGSVWAQIPPAEQLLPDDVIGVVTVPDWTKLTAGYERSSWGQLWADASMKPFRENFSSNFQADFLKPLEKQLGLKLTEYQELLQGQVTLAFTAPKEGSKNVVSVLLLVDAKDKAEQLKTRLADLKKKWTDAGKDVKAEKIRDVDFSSISVSSSDVHGLLKKAFPGGDEDADPDEKKDKAAPDEKIQLRIGQYKSLLVIGEDEKVIEKILARQGGGMVAPLADKGTYQKTHQALFRESVGHAWVNFKPIYKKILEYAAAEKQEPTPGMPSMKLEKILPALGFASLDSLAARINSTADGSSADFLIGVPEGQREGLFKVFALEKKDASPPPFVPADVLKMQRTRLNGAKAWAAVEETLMKIDPSVAGLVQMMLGSAGKDKDPNFDLKKNLFSNLGDDIISYERPPKSTKVADLATRPSILLIGSPNPPQLLDAIRLLSTLMPGPFASAPVKEREFLGKKIYTMSMTPPVPPGEKDEDDKSAPAPTSSSLNFCASAGYVAFSGDPGMIEEFLRSAENPPKPLRATAGLAEAAQKAGGMENGMFTYENAAESLRIASEALKNDPEAMNRSLFFSLSGGDEEGQGAFKRLFNLKLLPSFDRVAKYFGIALVTAGTTQDGYMVKAFNPMPAGLKK